MQVVIEVQGKDFAFAAPIYFGDGKTAEEVGVHQLAKRLTREEAIHLRSEFSRQETNRISQNSKWKLNFRRRSSTNLDLV